MVLQHKTREIADGRFVSLPEMKAPQEIRHLTGHFNAMSARLKELDALKEFPCNRRYRSRWRTYFSLLLISLCSHLTSPPNSHLHR